MIGVLPAILLLFTAAPALVAVVRRDRRRGCDAPETLAVGLAAMCAGLLINTDPLVHALLTAEAVVTADMRQAAALSLAVCTGAAVAAAGIQQASSTRSRASHAAHSSSMRPHAKEEPATSGRLDMASWMIAGVVLILLATADRIELLDAQLLLLGGLALVWLRWTREGPKPSLVTAAALGFLTSLAAASLSQRLHFGPPLTALALTAVTLIGSAAAGPQAPPRIALLVPCLGVGLCSLTYPFVQLFLWFATRQMVDAKGFLASFSDILAGQAFRWGLEVLFPAALVVLLTGVVQILVSTATVSDSSKRVFTGLLQLAVGIGVVVVAVAVGSS